MFGRSSSTQTTRLLTVLENLSASVMVADNDRNIVYINQALISFLTESEGTFKTTCRPSRSRDLSAPTLIFFTRIPNTKSA